MDNIFKTKHQQFIEQKEADVYADYQTLAADPDKSRIAIAEYLCRKYGYKHIASIYDVRHRVEKRMAKELTKQK